MRYDVPPRQRSTGTVVLVIVLLGFLFLVGLAVVAFGVLLFARAESRQAHVEMAVRHAEDARARAEHIRARAEEVRQRVVAESRNVLENVPAMAAEAEPAGTADEKGSIQVANREITIQLDEAGKIQVDGTACELPQLKDMLDNAGHGRENAITVLVKAHKRCLVEPVMDVLAVCKELGFPVRLAALDD